MSALDESRARIYRLVFALAAACNITLAAWAIVRPRGLFDLFAMEAPRDPAIWQLLGIVVGVLGLGFAHAARRIDRAVPYIAVGLLAKMLGPIGWVAAVRAGEWPIRTFTLILFSDLVWWLPFALFLLEGRRAGARLRASAPYLCATLNCMAALAMPVALSPGLDPAHEFEARADYIGAHLILWRAGWGLWVVASLSLLGFFCWWAARVRSRPLGMAALALAVAGLGSDLLGESLCIGWLPAGSDRTATLARLLTGAWGNTLYALAGALLTLGSRWLRGPARVFAWLIWSAGLALGGFSLAGNSAGMAASMALLFALFCPWAAWMGFLDRRRVNFCEGRPASVTARPGTSPATGGPGGGADLAAFYERHQEWPGEVGRAVAEHLLSALGPPPRRCLFLGSGTGVNDVLPFARQADPRDQVVGSDVEPAYLDRLAEHARREGLRNVVVRRLDVRRDLADLGAFDLVTLFFVIHRLSDWQDVVAPLARLVGPRGALYLSEFAGPGGLIYLSNERGGGLADPVSRMIRRYFELLPEAYDPPLKSSRIGPVREALARHLEPAGWRDFDWAQRLTAGDMYAKIESRAYAPYLGTPFSPDVLDHLRHEHEADWLTTVELTETVRVYRFLRTQGVA